MNPFQGLSKDAVPGGVHILNSSDPIYTGQDALYFLDESRKQVPRSNLDMPEDAAIYALEDQSHDFIRVWWKNSEGRQWSLVNPGKNHLTHNNMYVRR